MPLTSHSPYLEKLTSNIPAEAQSSRTQDVHQEDYPRPRRCRRDPDGTSSGSLGQRHDNTLLGLLQALVRVEWQGGLFLAGEDLRCQRQPPNRRRRQVGL